MYHCSMIRIPSDNSNPTMKSRFFWACFKKVLVFLLLLLYCAVLSFLVSLKLCSHKYSCQIYEIKHVVVNKKDKLLAILLLSLSLISCSIPGTILNYFGLSETFWEMWWWVFMLKNAVDCVAHCRFFRWATRGKVQNMDQSFPLVVLIRRNNCSMCCFIIEYRLNNSA